jgi:hypothetical protein
MQFDNTEILEDDCDNTKQMISEVAKKHAAA